MARYTFKKEERLCNKRLLAQLYQSGSSFLLYPYKVVFLPYTPLNAPVQVVISVSKRRFKKAVERNLLKRRIREAYRLRKAEQLYTFLEDKATGLLLSIQYVGKEIHDSTLLHCKMEQLLFRLRDEYIKSLWSRGLNG